MEAWESNVDIPSIHIYPHTQKKKKESGLQPPIMHGRRKEINLDNGGKGPA